MVCSAAVSYTWISPLESREEVFWEGKFSVRERVPLAWWDREKNYRFQNPEPAEGWNDTLGGRMGCTGAVHRQLAPVPLAGCGFSWLWPGWISRQLLCRFTTISQHWGEQSGSSTRQDLLHMAIFKCAWLKTSIWTLCWGGWWESTSGWVSGVLGTLTES